MPDLRKEIALYEAYSNAPVIALGINHEGLDLTQIGGACASLESEFDIPAVDVLTEGAGRLVKSIVNRFPHLTK